MMKSFGLSRTGGLLVSGVIACVAVHAPAQAHVRTFDVPAAEASRGVPLFARQAGIQLLASARHLRGKRTNAVRGSYTAQAALRHLLSGTGLEATEGGSGIITIRPASLQAVAAAPPPPGTAQDVAPQVTEPTQLPDSADLQGDIVVTGVRQSLQNSINVKRAANQIVDAVSAVDIGKLPDVTAADALQRVTGVQLTRNFGEGSRVSIRGLQSVRVEINGRGLYTPSIESSPGNSSGRNAGLEQLSSALFSRLEVKKTPVASQIEGGLGGVVNAVTYKPFDFRKPTLVLNAEGSRGNIADHADFSLIGLVSSKFADDTLGFVASASYQDTVVGFDSLARMNWNEGPTGVDLNNDGKRDLRVNEIHGEFFRVTRKRLGLNGNVTYRPNSDLELYVDGTYARLTTNRDTRIVLQGIGNAPILNPVFDGNYIVAGTVTSTPFAAGTTDRREPSSFLELAAGGKWSTPLADLRFEVATSDTKQQIDQNYYELGTIANIPMDFDFRGRDIPVFRPGGSVDLTQLSNYRTRNTIRSYGRTPVSEDSGRLDFDWKTGLDFLKIIRTGIRYSRVTRSSRTAQTNLNSPGEPPAPPIQNNADRFYVQGWPIFGGTDAQFPSSFVTIEFDALLDANPALFGDTPIRLEPTGASNLEEQTYAAYAEADLTGEAFGIPFRGNAGVRVVQTRSSIASNQVATVPGVGVTVTPRVDRTRYTDWLPSANIAFDLREDLTLRLSAAKVLARQAFNQLSPSYTANVAVAPVSVSGGNASLRPTQVTQADLSIEYYLNSTSYASATLFYKDATGFPVTQSTLQVAPGYEQYGIVLFNQPINSGTADIKGFELSYQQTFNFLPGALDGLGAIGSFTYVDGETNTGDPVVDLSRESYNVTGFYEKFGINARISYVWRSERLYNIVIGGSDPAGSGRRNNFVGAVGTLDASIGYDITKNINIYASGSNLLFADSAVSYYNVIPDARIRYDLNESRLSVGARLKF
jgi:iron complex outermembrane recepter protein